MNPRQLARLDGGQIAAFNKVLRKHRDLLAWFGYDLMDPQGRACWWAACHPGRCMGQDRRWGGQT